MDKDVTVVPPERIERSILLIRGQKVMLSADLADLCQLEITNCDFKLGRSSPRQPRLDEPVASLGFAERRAFGEAGPSENP